MNGRILILLCVVLSSSAWAQRTSLLRALDNSLIRTGPSESFPALTEPMRANDAVFLLGVSPGRRWYRIMKRNGFEGWVPRNRVHMAQLSEEEIDDLRAMRHLKTKITSRWILTAGATYGSTPLSVGAVAMPFLNLARNGVFGRKTEQIELGVGFGYHFYSKKYFYEVPFALQWIFRSAFWYHFMIGPRIGFSVVDDPNFRFDHSIPFEGGLHARYFFDDDWGVYFDALVVARSVIYYMGGAGLAVRF